MRYLLGKFLVGNHETRNGEPVTIIAGVAKGHLVDHGDHCGMLAKMFLVDWRFVRSKLLEDMSPEDFIESGIDQADWSQTEPIDPEILPTEISDTICGLLEERMEAVPDGD